MNAFTLENPVFVIYAIAASLMVLKLMGQGWMTVVRMIRSDAGLLNPEDIRADQLTEILARRSSI